MKATRTLHDLGQSIWLDNISRGMINSGTLRRYIDELSVTGLTSNPTIFDHAIEKSSDYDEAIRSKVAQGQVGGEAVFRARAGGPDAGRRSVPAGLRADGGVDGWVSLEVSPLLAHDTKIDDRGGQGAARRRRNVRTIMIKIPGTPEGLPAIEEVDLCRGADQRHVAVLRRAVRGGRRCVHARHRAAHRGRLDARHRLGRVDLHQPMGCCGKGQGAGGAQRQLGIAVAKQAYKEYLSLLISPRWMRAYNAGARPQRLLWASTGTKDPKASDVLYVNALAAPFTVNTMPERRCWRSPITARSARRCRRTVATATRCWREFAKAGSMFGALANQLQERAPNHSSNPGTI